MWALLAALALAATGAGLQAAGASASRRAMNARTQEELNRQAQIQRQAEAEYAQSLAQSGVDTAQQQVQQGTQEREGLYQQLQQVPLETGAQQVEVSPAVRLRDAAQMQLANKSRAKLGGYETWVLDQAIKNARAGQNLNILSQQAQRSQNILPLELQAASHEGDTLQGIGSLVGSLGSLFGGYGALVSGATQAGMSARQAAQPQQGYGWIGGGN